MGLWEIMDGYNKIMRSCEAIMPKDTSCTRQCTTYTITNLLNVPIANGPNAPSSFVSYRDVLSFFPRVASTWVYELAAEGCYLVQLAHHCVGIAIGPVHVTSWDSAHNMGKRLFGEQAARLLTL